MSDKSASPIIRIEIVSMENEIYAGEALRVTAPALLGSVGILPRHAPMISPLRAGEVRIHTPDNNEILIYISGGLLEVQPSVVTILADTAVRAKHLDEAAAAEARRLATEAQLHLDRFTDYDKAYIELLTSIAEMMQEKTLHKKRRRW